MSHLPYYGGFDLVVDCCGVHLAFRLDGTEKLHASCPRSHMGTIFPNPRGKTQALDFGEVSRHRLLRVRPQRVIRWVHHIADTCVMAWGTVSIQEQSSSNPGTVGDLLVVRVGGCDYDDSKFGFP